LAESSRTLIVVVGPTAIGKSTLACRLALRFGGEIVGCDSAQIYRSFDVATAKPPRDVRERIPHHLIDVADPSRDFSAGDYARLAEAAVRRIRARGARPIVAGGTGLYLRAFLRGLAEMPRRNERLRARLMSLAERKDENYLHRILKEHDPDTGARLSPRDRQRIVRALEVIFETGRPFSRIVEAAPFGEERHPTVKVGLRMPWSLLMRRIEARVDEFFAAGLVDEVRDILDAGVPPSSNAFKALGYREVIELLAGRLDLPSTVALVKANTRRYARRQLTWFRREPGVVWFDLGEEPGQSFEQIEADVALRLTLKES
jgi:tRNA dimethylallyltransferase